MYTVHNACLLMHLMKAEKKRYNAPFKVCVQLTGKSCSESLNIQDLMSQRSQTFDDATASSHFFSSTLTNNDFSNGVRFHFFTSSFKLSCCEYYYGCAYTTSLCEHKSRKAVHHVFSKQFLCVNKKKHCINHAKLRRLSMSCVSLLL